MRLIISGINGHYLRYITDNFASQTDEVLAAGGGDRIASVDEMAATTG